MGYASIGILKVYSVSIPLCIMIALKIINITLTCTRGTLKNNLILQIIIIIMQFYEFIFKRKMYVYTYLTCVVFKQKYTLPCFLVHISCFVSKADNV